MRCKRREIKKLKKKSVFGVVRFVAMNNETDVGNGWQRLNGAEAFGFGFNRGFFQNDDVAAGKPHRIDELRREAI